MGLSDTLKCFADDMYENTKQKECMEKAKKVVNSERVTDKTSLNSTIERVRKIYDSMTVESWEKLYDDLCSKADQFEIGTMEYEKAIAEGVYIWNRKELIYHAYAKILREQPHAEELLKKLKTELKELDIRYDKTLSKQIELGAEE